MSTDCTFLSLPGPLLQLFTKSHILVRARAREREREREREGIEIYVTDAKVETTTTSMPKLLSAI